VPRLPGLSIILLVALGLRAAWALLIPVDPVSDSAAYDMFATNIVLHGVYGFVPTVPSAYWAVGPAAIYAASYMVFGVGSTLGVLVPNLVSALVSVWLIHDLGRRWFGETEARLAALALALWPLGIQFTTVLASELHFIALTLAGLAAWDRVGRGRALGWLVLSGVALGAATYVRPIALLVPAALAVAAILRAPRAAGSTVLMAGVVTAIILALVSPWSARNERVLGERVFVSTNFWPNFWMGNVAGTDGQYVPLTPEAEAMHELDRARHLRAISLEHLQADPMAFVWRTVWKAFALHERETIGVAWNEAGIIALAGPRGATALKALSTLYWYGVLATGLAGVVVVMRRMGWWTGLLSPPVWMWLYLTAIHAVIVIGDRYHMPSYPFIALLSGVALAALLSRKAVAGGVSRSGSVRR
jgi:4-amino-4-deoxy-L-arabinose transferase-like glycosyltransferase